MSADKHDDADLIAAAPDLLAAATRALSCMRAIQQHVGAVACGAEVDELAAAVAKAAGAAS